MFNVAIDDIPKRQIRVEFTIGERKAGGGDIGNPT